MDDNIKFHGVEGNTADKVYARAIDDHMMAAYNLMKILYPDFKGYQVRVAEEEDGHVRTRFYMIPYDPKEGHEYDR